MSSFLTTLVVMLFCVNFSQARSIPESCTPSPRRQCYNYCSDVTYYYSNSTGKCERCISCPEGKEPDKDNPCTAQADGEEVSCVECEEGSYSSQEDQMHCFPCRTCGHKIIDQECTAFSDTVCSADCKPGLYEVAGECLPCEYIHNSIDRDKCERSATTTSKSTTTTSKSPTTLTIHKTNAPETTNSISTSGKIATTKNKTTNAGVNKNSPTTVDKGGHRSNDKELSDLIFQLSVVGGSIIVFAMVTYCIVYYIKSTKNNSDSRKSSGASSAGFSVAAGELAGSASNPRPTANVTRPPSATDSINTPLPTTSANINLDNSVAKKCTDRVKIKEEELDKLKLQRKPDGVNGTSTKPGSPSPNASSKKCGRSMSVPEINITPNVLNTSNTTFTQDFNILNTGLKPLSSDASSGDESDGLSPVQEDALLIKHSKPRPKNGKGSGSSTLGVPQRSQRMRRKSLPCHMPSVLPLRSDGGQFSFGSAHGSSADLQSTSSANNSRFSSSVHSLSSQPKSECNKQRKDRQLRRLRSYEDKAMKHHSETGPAETDSLLKGDEFLKGTVITHPEQLGGHYEPAFNEGSYQPFYRMYGAEDPLQVDQNIIDLVPAQRQQYPEPIAKCTPTTAPSASTSNHSASSRSTPSAGSKSTPEVPSPACHTNDLPYRPNSPFTPSSNAQRSQQLPNSEEHLQPAGVVHIYNAPVLQQPVFNSTNNPGFKLTICNTNNQIQKQSDLGAGSTKTDVPKTPEGVECTEPIL